MVREPLARFASGYREVLAALTFGPPPDFAQASAQASTAAAAVASGSSAAAAAASAGARARLRWGMIDMAGGPVEAARALRAAPGWPRVPRNSSAAGEDGAVWLWAGQPLNEPWNHQARGHGQGYDQGQGHGQGRGQGHGGSPLEGDGRADELGGAWNETARFIAFARAAECSVPFLGWAHTASATWFLSGPRHALTFAQVGRNTQRASV